MSVRWQPGQSGNLAGRPKGAVNRRSKEILAEARERGVDPIEVLFAAIEHFLARAEEATGEEQDGHLMSAVSIAKEAAPYCHPRLRAVDISASPPPDPLTSYTDDELGARWQAVRARKAGMGPTDGSPYVCRRRDLSQVERRRQGLKDTLASYRRPSTWRWYRWTRELSTSA